LRAPPAARGCLTASSVRTRPLAQRSGRQRSTGNKRALPARAILSVMLNSPANHYEFKLPFMETARPLTAFRCDRLRRRSSDAADGRRLRIAWAGCAAVTLWAMTLTDRAVELVRVVMVSPGDVVAEREAVASVAESSIAGSRQHMVAGCRCGAWRPTRDQAFISRVRRV
jgi:hypothetical protein